MNKKGFTLTELIGVIIILGLIAIIAFPPLLKQIKGTQTTIDEATEKMIKVGASNYVNENKNNFPKINNNVYCISLQMLIDDGKLSNDLVDSKGDKLDTNKFVKINITNNQYNYNIVDSCSEVK